MSAPWVLLLKAFPIMIGRIRRVLYDACGGSSMPFDVRFALNTLWFALGVCWAVMAFTAKRTVRKQSTGARWFHLFMVVLAFGLMFSESLRIGPLAARVIPDSAPIAIMGLFLTAVGVAF